MKKIIIFHLYGFTEHKPYMLFWKNGIRVVLEEMLLTEQMHLK